MMILVTTISLVFVFLKGISHGFIIPPSHPLVHAKTKNIYNNNISDGSKSGRVGIPLHVTVNKRRRRTTTLFSESLSSSNEVGEDTATLSTRMAATETATSTKAGWTTHAQSVASTVLLVTIDVVLRRYFKQAGLSFPSSLAGCGLLFSSLVILSSINASWGDGVYSIFSPGASLLSKWLAVFFVPSLVTLPLAQPLGSALEVRKC